MNRSDRRFRPTLNGLPARLAPSCFVAMVGVGDDPLPEPEGPPGTDPGPTAPITLPPMPASGPIGPGTS